MKLGVLFSGGKDSVLSAWLMKKIGYELSCLISIDSKNLNSFMFHTPSIKRVVKQAEAMDIPLILKETDGKKEDELVDLEMAIIDAIKKYKIKGIVTGAICSVYQASRIQDICDKLKIKCINPLWQKNQIELLNDLINENFEVVISGVFAYPIGQDFLGRKIDIKFINDVKVLEEKYKINPAGEGGEFESFVLNCPLFKKGLKIISFSDKCEGENSWRREFEVDF